LKRLRTAEDDKIVVQNLVKFACPCGIEIS